MKIGDKVKVSRDKPSDELVAELQRKAAMHGAVYSRDHEAADEDGVIEFIQESAAGTSYGVRVTRENSANGSLRVVKADRLSPV